MFRLDVVMQDGTTQKSLTRERKIVLSKSDGEYLLGNYYSYLFI